MQSYFYPRVVHDLEEGPRVLNRQHPEACLTLNTPEIHFGKIHHVGQFYRKVFSEFQREIVSCDFGPGPGEGGEQVCTTIYRVGNQQGPTVEHRELYSIFCNNL